jgi:hypothetical protein
VVAAEAKKCLMLSKSVSLMKSWKVTLVKDAGNDIVSGEAVGFVVALFAGLMLACNIVSEAG